MANKGSQKKSGDLFSQDADIYLPEPIDAISWWMNLERAWPHIRKILAMTLELTGPSPKPDAAPTLEDYLLLLCRNGDPDVLIWLQKAWLLGPEMLEIYAYPGWSALTDLIANKDMLFEMLDPAQTDLLHAHEASFLEPLAIETARRKEKQAEMKKLLKDRRKELRRLKTKLSQWEKKQMGDGSEYF